ncbi:FecR family protein [Spirochaeta lutea]|uniref:FecR family protein n=1 Tax=Spirochaeta lutea TaxID=1480694 RepID=UPI00068E69AF|nr:FecR domain-containing protein [Spirochaeta lutea]
MKKLVLLVMLAGLLAGAPLFAQEGQLTDVTGKVEVRGQDGAWRPVSNGTVVALSDTISTGFNSSATLKLGSNNVLIKPLTRMVLDEYVEREGAVSTSLHLRVGSVRASVDSSRNIDQKFEVTSPYSTASVRGTEFDFNGLNLQVLAGIVALRLGPPRRPQGAPGPGTPLPQEPGAGDDGDSGDSGTGEGGGQGDGSGEPGEGEGAGEQQPSDSGDSGTPQQPGQDDGPTIIVGAGGQVVINNPGPRRGGRPDIRTGDQILNDNSNVSTDTSSVGRGGTTGGGDDQPQRPQSPRPTTGTVRVEWTWREE